jgi:hypothetical protein
MGVILKIVSESFGQPVLQRAARQLDVTLEAELLADAYSRSRRLIQAGAAFSFPTGRQPKKTTKTSKTSKKSYYRRGTQGYPAEPDFNIMPG